MPSDRCDEVTIRIWPKRPFRLSNPQSWKSTGHVALRTYRGGANDVGYYASFWPGICHFNYVDQDNPVLHGKQNQCNERADHLHYFPEQDNFMYGGDNPPDGFTIHLHSLDIDAINRKFEKFRDSEFNWTIFGSTSPKKEDQNCCALVFELLKAGGILQFIKKSDTQSNFLIATSFALCVIAVVVGISGYRLRQSLTDIKSTQASTRDYNAKTQDAFGDLATVIQSNGPKVEGIRDSFLKGEKNFQDTLSEMINVTEKVQSLLAYTMETMKVVTNIKTTAERVQLSNALIAVLSGLMGTVGIHVGFKSRRLITHTLTPYGVRAIVLKARTRELENEQQAEEKQMALTDDEAEHSTESRDSSSLSLWHALFRQIRNHKWSLGLATLVVSGVGIYLKSAYQGAPEPVVSTTPSL